jgi:hypothetical protein
MYQLDQKSSPDTLIVKDNENNIQKRVGLSYNKND